MVEAVYLYANRYCSITGAVVVPNKQCFKERGIPEDIELSKSIAAVSMLLEDIKKACTEQGLKSFEIPKVVIIEDVPWTPENGMLTPALKVKRPACKEKYDKTMLYMLKTAEGMDAKSVETLAQLSVNIMENGIAQEEYDKLSCDGSQSAYSTLK